MRGSSTLKALKRVIKGIGFAIEGFKFAFREDEHFRINLVLSLIGVVLSLILLSGCERVILSLINYLVLVVESINTSIERAVDTATKEFHPVAKASKDTAAMAVLTIGLFALISDIIFLLPKLLEVVWRR